MRWPTSRRLAVGSPSRGPDRRLKQHPCLHPIGDRAGTRELPCQGGYRAIYELSPDTGRNDTSGDILVLRVLVFGPGQARDRP